VPSAVGDFMILDAIRESGGRAVAVAEDRVIEAMRRASAAEGIPVCPESAAGVLAIEQLVRAGHLGPDDHVVLFNTGSATKYVEAVAPVLPVLTDTDAVDYTAIARCS